MKLSFPREDMEPAERLRRERRSRAVPGGRLPDDRTSTGTLLERKKGRDGQKAVFAGRSNECQDQYTNGTGQLMNVCFQTSVWVRKKV